MDLIPPGLISSLTTLGLAHDDARVFASLVLLDHAEAKEIVEYLGLSKPSVYKALENLSGRGLAIKQRSKPARYVAVSPGIAVSILMREQEKASAQALAELKKLEQEKIRTDDEEPLWTIYGDTNTSHKIRELFRRAKQHINLVVGDRYIPMLETLPVRDIPLRLILVTSVPGVIGKMQEKFDGRPVEIYVIPLEKLTFPPADAATPVIEEAWKFMKFENVLELNVDDEELLMSVAFFSRGASVLDTRNKGAIIQMKMLSGLFWGRFISGEKR